MARRRRRIRLDTSVTGRRAASEYADALAIARRRGFAQTTASLERIREAFLDAIARVTMMAADATTDPLTLARASSLRGQLLPMLDRLGTLTARVTTDGVAATIDDVLGLHADVLDELMNAAGLSADRIARVVGQLDALNVRALAVMTARHGGSGTAAHFRTLALRNVEDAAPAVDRLLESAVSRGVSSERVTRDLAKLLAGRDPNLLGSASVDVDLSAYALRETDVSGLGTLWSDARRIAVTETNTALREANAQAMRSAKVVGAVKWQLSGRHGALGRWDECDSLATSDLFGLGPGWYPPAQFPAGPHPYCACVHGAVKLRPAKDWGTAYPAALLMKSPRWGAAPSGTDRDLVARIRAKSLGAVRAA